MSRCWCRCWLLNLLCDRLGLPSPTLSRSLDKRNLLQVAEAGHQLLGRPYPSLENWLPISRHLDPLRISR